MLTASWPLLSERQARIMWEHPSTRNWRAASRPRPALPPVMMMVLPATLVPLGVGGIRGWPMVLEES